MKISEFCKYNGLTGDDNFAMIENCAIPREDSKYEFTLVMFTRSGNADFIVDGKEYHVGRRYISFMRPGTHAELLDQSSNFRANVLCIGGDLGMWLSVSNVFLTLFVMEDEPFLKASTEYAEAIHIFFESLARVMKFEGNPYREDCLKSILRAFFYSSGYFLFKTLKVKGDDLYDLSSKFPAYQDSAVSRFISLLETYSGSQRTLAFYADKMNYNPKYLSALIKKETGHTGQSLIDRYAVLKAMAKLSYSDKSIKEISNELDFPSQSDFGKFFKRVTGESPLAFRKSRRGGRI